MKLVLEEWAERLTCLWIIGCAAVFIVATRHWPLTSDASLMHYVVFLMHHGMAPYRDIIDMNLPAAYQLECAAIAIFGPDSAGCRLYDLSLLALSSLALWMILRPYGRLAALLAAGLFILIHGRDGPLMTAERDLAATAFLLIALAMLFTFFRRRSRGEATAVGLYLGTGGAALGIAFNLKPTLLPLAAASFFWLVWALRRKRIAVKHPLGLMIAGASLAIASTFIFLFQHHSVGAFLAELHGLVMYHASLDNFSIGHLLQNSISPLLPMLLLWFVAAFLLRRQPLDPERIALILCALGGLLSYLLQGKAFWYQRYPFLAFLLPLFMIDFTRLLRSRTRGRYVGIAGMATGVVLATTCLMHLSTYDRSEPPRQVLQDLASLGTQAQLSGHVQCMDTIGGCIDALYHARIVQSTGFLYDCYLLDRSNPVVLDLRRRFWQQMERNPPNVIVITNSDCYSAEHTFDRFARWPEFESYLAANYVLSRESGPLPPLHYWSHPMEAYQYRIYVKR